MTRIKAAALGVLGLATVLAIIPVAALAAHHQTVARHPAGTIYGSLVSYNATSAVILTKAGDVTVKFQPSVAYVTYDQTAVGLGLQDGDQIKADGVFNDGTLRVDRLRYDNVPFVISGLLQKNGTYSSSTSTSLTITLAATGNMLTFNTNANTRFFLNGKRVKSPTFTANERLSVWAVQFSDQSWLARIVDLHSHA